MEFLNKFDNIEIKNDTRVPAEDLKVIEGYSKEFEEYRNRVLQYELLFKNKPLNPPLYGEDHCYSDLGQENFLEYFYSGFIKDCKKFANKIIYYFKNKYQIELISYFEPERHEYCFNSSNKYEEKLNFYKNLTHDTVLDSIFEQLGGFDLNSKMERETKDNMKKLCISCKDEERVQLSKNKITLKNIAIVTYDSVWREYEIDYNYDDNLTTFINAINYFESRSVNISKLNTIFYHNNGTGGINQEFVKNRIFEKIQLNFNKIKSIIFFKNRRIDIEFTSGQYALEFARDYCGYIG
ncbi:hypothetical protein G8V07_11470 [Clostridium botulinum D/C]|uniref:hypothetical protein n=1 Tax=Clostridium botulinum TaxID=1491 RepID=UPI001E2DE7A7|nr:hypothetical protein [Clostridium botulinum]MCD3319504.1 hypothetical protein [Clostridium botulinum D/C]MCD3324369.1 hypothetical protein [Clostridium botulinum D/C]MCD3327370.1 hypothetical protein [Clostridium botulinum D/C]